MAAVQIFGCKYFGVGELGATVAESRSRESRRCLEKCATSIVAIGRGESAHLDLVCFVAVERWWGLTGIFGLSDFELSDWTLRVSRAKYVDPSDARFAPRPPDETSGCLSLGVAVTARDCFPSQADVKLARDRTQATHLHSATSLNRAWPGFSGSVVVHHFLCSYWDCKRSLRLSHALCRACVFVRGVFGPDNCKVQIRVGHETGVERVRVRSVVPVPRSRASPLAAVMYSSASDHFEQDGTGCLHSALCARSKAPIGPTDGGG